MLGMGLSVVSAAAMPPLDGTLGSIDSGIRAGVMWSWNGSAITIIGQKNVSSVTRIAQGRWRIAFSSNLPDANYGMVGGGRFASASGDMVLVMQPDRNTNNSGDQYSISGIDVATGQPASSTVIDGEIMGFFLFDPGSVSTSNYLAAAKWSASSDAGNGTVDDQFNVSSVTRFATGNYDVNFTSNLPNASYSIFGSAKFFASAVDSVFPLAMGQNRETTTSNTRTVSKVPVTAGQIVAATSLSYSRVGSILVKDPTKAPRGTIASGSLVWNNGNSSYDLVGSYNVRSVDVTDSFRRYRVNFANPCADSNYIVMASGRWATAVTHRTPSIGANRNSSNNNGYNQNYVDLIAQDQSGSVFDAPILDFWVVKPWLM